MKSSSSPDTLQDTAANEEHFIFASRRLHCRRNTVHLVFTYTQATRFHQDSPANSGKRRGGLIRRTRNLAVGMLLLAAASPVPLVAAEPSYTIAARYALERSGAVGAMALDSRSRILYVGGATALIALNADSGRQVAGASLSSPVVALALAPEAHRLFVATRNGSVVVLDPGTLRRVQRIAGVTGASALAYDGGQRRVFVASAVQGTIAALDAASGRLAGSAHVGAGMGQMAANGYGRLFIADAERNQVYEVDTEGVKSLGAFPSRYGNGCGVLALDPVGRRLFVACRDGIVNVIDTDIGFTFQQLRAGRGASDAVFTFKPQGKAGWRGAAFIVSSDGMLTALRMNSYVSYGAGVSAKITEHMRGAVFDPATDRVFVAAPATRSTDGSSSGSEWQVLAIASSQR